MKIGLNCYLISVFLYDKGGEISAEIKRRLETPEKENVKSWHIESARGNWNNEEKWGKKVNKIHDSEGILKACIID